MPPWLALAGWPLERNSSVEDTTSTGAGVGYTIEAVPSQAQILPIEAYHKLRGIFNFQIHVCNVVMCSELCDYVMIVHTNNARQTILENQRP